MGLDGDGVEESRAGDGQGELGYAVVVGVDAVELVGVDVDLVKRERRALGGRRRWRAVVGW